MIALDKIRLTGLLRRSPASAGLLYFTANRYRLPTGRVTSNPGRHTQGEGTMLRRITLAIALGVVTFVATSPASAPGWPRS
jgi:hypothetical protein